jgi:hypothetical protein
MLLAESVPTQTLIDRRTPRVCDRHKPTRSGQSKNRPVSLAALALVADIELLLDVPTSNYYSTIVCDQSVPSRDIRSYVGALCLLVSLSLLDSATRLTQ